MELSAIPVPSNEAVEQAVRSLAAGPSATHGLVEYVGRTALVVTGPYTGARYSFAQPGARLEVDRRDRQSILSIPVLRGIAA